jgi:DNA polymerase III epsilon subunit-like protein
LNDFEVADIVVGHNIHFDINMILIEMLRQTHIFDNEWFQLFKNSNKFYCTMKNSIDLCAIKVPYKNSTKTYNKFPKLNELYNCLFQKIPNPANLHNALNDVIICLACFCKMYLTIQVDEINTEMKQLLDDII